LTQRESNYLRRRKRQYLLPFSSSVRGTVGYGLRYASSVDMSLQGYADADWAGSAVDRKSTSGCCFTLGSAMVSWCSRKQKHIEIKYHYIRDMVQRKAVHVQYLPTHEQIADIFTKPLAKTKFEYFRERLGLVENASLAEREC
jgi:hypothetical protein